jgi:hypothetical protein
LITKPKRNGKKYKDAYPLENIYVDNPKANEGISNYSQSNKLAHILLD